MDSVNLEITERCSNALQKCRSIATLKSEDEFFREKEMLGGWKEADHISSENQNKL